MSLFGTSASGAGGSILSGTSAQSTGGLFGTSTAAPTGGGLFGTTGPAAATSTPSLFGTTTTAPAATTGGLFGNATAAAPATTGSLFGAPATSTAAAPATGGLFGTTTAATAPTTGGLFGASTAAAPATTGGLFGSTATSTAAAPATGGLFGTTTSTAPASGGLFGATSTTTTSAAGSGVSLFGTPTTSTAATTLGLGGTQQKLGTTTTGGTTTTSLAIGGEKEAVKDGEIAGAAQIREMLPLIEACLKKNREIIEDVENTTVDNGPISIDEMIDKTRTWMNESRRNIREASDMSTYVASLVADDKQFLETAKKLQDASTTSNQTTLCNTIKSHLFELTENYDSQMCQMQKRVEGIHTKFERLLNGESALSMCELTDMFKRCDQSYANAQYHIHETGREIEALKNMLIEQGYTHLRKSYPQYSATTISSSNEGAEFFPSQSSLAVIGSALRAPPTAAATTTGLGLGTTGGLFGSTGSSSLFGSTNTAATSKPLFGSTTATGGGSLFGNLTNTATSTAPATSSVTPGATSSASLFGSKMTPMSTVTNNSSGLLFSMKK